MTDLKGIFDKEGDHGLYTYKHKHEKELLEAAKAELAKCPTGEYQVKVVDVQDINLNILKGTDQIILVPDGHNVYVTAPANMSKPNPELILDIAVGIREAEHKLLGFKIPDEETDPKGHQLQNHSLQLDLIVHMFKIADEMRNNAGSTVFLDIINNYGYSSLYKLYEQNVSQEELAGLYLEYTRDNSETGT